MKKKKKAKQTNQTNKQPTSHVIKSCDRGEANMDVL